MLYAQYLRNNIQRAHVYSATQVQCKCNVSFHIVLFCSGDCGNLAVFLTSLVHTKLCLLQTIPHCKGEQNYGGVTLFVRTYICSVQNQMTVSAADSDSYTESNISHVTSNTCDTCVCDVKVWCHK